MKAKEKAFEGSEREGIKDNSLSLKANLSLRLWSEYWAEQRPRTLRRAEAASGSTWRSAIGHWKSAEGRASGGTREERRRE